MDIKLTREDIMHYFMKINDELVGLGVEGEIVMTGGAAMSLVYNARNSTHDIDAIYEPKLYMLRIIKDIAEKNNINKDWLNDGVKGFLSSNMTSSTVLKLSNLEVKSLDADCLLAMKLASARTLTQDMNDAIVLMQHLKIQKSEQLFDIIKKYIPLERQTAQVKFFTLEAFEKYIEITPKYLLAKKSDELLKAAAMKYQFANPKKALESGYRIKSENSKKQSNSDMEME